MVYKIHVRVSVCLRACQSPTTICSCVNRVAPKALDSYLSPQFIFVFFFFSPLLQVRICVCHTSNKRSLN